MKLKAASFLLLLFPFLFPFSSHAEPEQDILFILDASAGMARVSQGRRLIDWAGEALQQTLREFPEGAEAGLRVMGGRLEVSAGRKGCRDSEAIVPIGQDAAGKITPVLGGIAPKGSRPLGFALEQAARDFAGKSQTLHRIVILTAGNDDCAADILVSGILVGQKGFKFKIDVVGLDIEPGREKRLELLASEFGGAYYPVNGGNALAAQLSQAARTALAPPKPRVVKDFFEEARLIEHGESGRDILYILDASGSMTEPIRTGSVGPPRRKFDWAFDALQEALASLSKDTAFGVRVYGPPPAADIPECEASHLLIPIDHWDWQKVFYGKIGFVSPKGKTPIAYSLRRAREDFRASPARHHRIILLSDGEETCEGDPVQEAKELAQEDASVDVLGFDVGPEAAEQLKAVAEAGGGSFVQAKSGKDLQQKLAQMSQSGGGGGGAGGAGGGPGAGGGGAGGGGAVSPKVFDFQSPKTCGVMGILVFLILLVLVVAWMIRQKNK